MAYFERDGARIRYDIFGDGPLIVFVHGAGANSLVFFQQVAYFSQKCRVACMDMRGFGGSICDPATFHPRQFSDDLAALLDIEARGPTAVVCQSMGAWSGLPLAVREPERFAGLVISSSPTPAYGPHHKVLEQVSDRFGKVAEGKKVALQDLGFSDEFIEKRPDLIALYQMLSRMNQKLDLSKISDPELRLMPEDFRDYRTPTFILGGAKNRLLGKDTHIEAAKCIPGASSFTFEKSGHSSFFEEPDNYNRVVDEFFTRLGYFNN
jgi:pimeloyl-ACP methyl ester carboxylesterase